MKKVHDVGGRVGFKDDVIINHPKSRNGDVTDLIFFVRNAACHIDSGNRKVTTPKAKNATVSFNIILGKYRWEPFHGIVLESDYADDICFFYGPYKIYLQRHIVRAFHEAREILKPHLQQTP